MRFTTLTHGGGCACKIPPGALQQLIAVSSPNVSYPALVVGSETGDDAAVYSLGNSLKLVSTIDYFAPVVDDAYEWGQIAAANALSDVYAMGGNPILALNVLAWPTSRVPIELSAAVLEGGRDKCAEAGVPIGGGHSIDVPDEPLYGLAVTGLIDGDHMMTNNAATSGLPLTLTKPLGVGIWNNFHKKTGSAIPAAIDLMKKLNLEARDAAIAAGVRSATDVTGFGLLGHAHKMAAASGVTIEIDSSSVPFLGGTEELAEAGYISGGTRRNLDWVRPFLQNDSGLSDTELLTLSDAQTSGGLLLAGEVPGYPIIGRITDASDVTLRLT